MTLDTVSYDKDGSLLLALFIENTRKSLEKQIVAALKPAINSAIDHAIAELRPQIQKQFDMRRQEMAFVITHREVK